jgi:hypothetical protein
MFLNGLLHGCSLLDLSYGIICESRHHKAVMLNGIDVLPPPSGIFKLAHLQARSIQAIGRCNWRTLN